MSNRIFAAAALVVLAAAFLASAQETRGTVLGRVSDPSGAVIAGAEVRATNVATGVAAAARSNEAGNYTLPYLLPGPYTITAELAGFKRFVREGIQVRVNDSVEVNITLQVGDVTETVEVRAETPLLSTSEASLGQVIDQRRVAELPSFGGSAMVLVQLSPGVLNTTDLRLAKGGSFSINKNSQFSTDGAGQYNNSFTLDGVTNTQASGTSARVGFIPPQEAIAEFKVQTASFDATVATIGALVNVSTKAGTNEYHGELHWWVRNRIFDTPTLFQNRSGQKLAVYQDNRYGLTIGGPVRIPRAYNGKNKTFFFYAWESNQFGVPSPFTGTVPTEGMRRGDLSSLLRIGPNYQIFDPLTTTAVAGGRFQRQPFQNNIIPATRLDAVAQKILPHWSQPNQAGTNEGRNNYFGNRPASEDTWVHLARIDQAFSEKHRAFVRFNKDFWEEHKNQRFDSIATGIVLNRLNEGISIDDVYVFNPTFLVNVRYGITYGIFTERRQSKGFDLASLGFSPQLVSLVDSSRATFPNVRVGSLTPLGDWEDPGDGGNFSTVHSFRTVFTKLRGGHNLRFGVDLNVFRENVNRYPFDVSPRLEYSTTYTRGPFDNSPSQPVGGELAAFLLGVPDGQLAITASIAEQNTNWGLYLQDDWKLTSKLTVNWGLRYEYESPVRERYNRSVAHFAFDQPNPVEAQARANYARSPIPELPAGQFRVPGGLTFAGVNGNGRSYWNGEKNNLMPRFGLAYQLLPKTVLRAGYGLFFGTIGVNATDSIQTGFSQSTPIQASLDSGLSYRATNANPFPTGLIAPPGSRGGLATNLGQSISFFAVDRKQPYIQRWSLGLQQALPSQFLLEASYVGSRGTRLGVNRNLNNTPEQYLSRLPVRDQPTINFLSQQFANPLAGTNPIYGVNISRANLLRPFPQFSNVMVNEPIGYSWYHSLQVRGERRFSRGFTFLLAYTWAKNMEAAEFLNPTDPIPYESIASLDRPHHLVVSWIWELPFGRNKRFGSGWPRALDVIAGGWQLNSLVQRQSGPPLGFGDVWTLYTGNPNNVNLSKDQRSVDRWFNTDAGFNRNNAQQLANNIRFSPLRFSNIRGDGQARWDFSAIKNFPIRERFKMQFRVECLNAWNHPNLSTPNTSPTNSAFGAITGQDVPRSWQMSLKLAF